MLLKVLAVAGWAAVAFVSTASAQSLAGPAENPPAGFNGSQYVDSRGCVFLRAGIGGRVNWVPRISRDRKALCGQSRAASARADAAMAAAEPAPATRTPAPVMRQEAPAPRVVQRAPERVGKPMETIASVQRTAPPPQPRVLQRAPLRVDVPAPQMQPRASSRMMNGCPAGSPYGARVTLSDGRRSLICSSDSNFDVQTALASVQVAGRATAPTRRTAAPVAMATNDGYTPRRPAASRGYAPQSGYDGYAPRPATNGAVYNDGYASNDGYTPKASRSVSGGGYVDVVTVPKGYKAAWDDDRLNPKRGRGTARGQAQQDGVWSRDIPAERVTAAPQVQRRTYTTSTSNAPRTPKSGGRYYVQVGTFGEAGNAARTASRLQGLGLPVTKSRITSKGRAMQIVMAGPFRDAGSAQAALSAARRSGFGDAFIR